MKKIISLIFTLFFITFIGCDKVADNIDTTTNIDFSKIKNINMTEDKINLVIDGQPISLSSPVYLDKNRYYLCLNDIVLKLNGSIKKEGNNLLIDLLDHTFTIDVANNKFKNSDDFEDLKKSLIIQDEFYYINFSDLSNILDMYTRWDVSSKTIYCKTFGNSIENVNVYSPKIDTLGFLRLEDIGEPTQSFDKDYLDKVRIIGNYLSKKNVPYHIAWIPRIVSPELNIDVDPLTRNDFATCDLVYTLDFFNTHNGLIGLHGYTHQCGKQESAVGTEFGKNEPSTTVFKEKIEKAIATSKYLDIPITFFEAPHYDITTEQTKIAENYFKILYYPLKANPDLTKPQKSPYNNSCYYISTPLDYIPENNIAGAFDRIKKCDTKKMGSVFYHPRLDFKDINLNLDNNIPTYQYSDNSTLKTLISLLEEKGFKMSKVSDIN